MFFNRIQHRLIFIFVSLVVAILLIGGWTLHWMIRQSLEAELGRKLMAVANAASVQFEEEEIGFLLHGAGTRTRRRFYERLMRLKTSTGVRRITFFDLEGRSLLDTEAAMEQGASYFNLQFYRNEMGLIREGRSTHSILFQGIDGRPMMTGYAPLFQDGKVAGGIGVDGSVTFLSSVNRLWRRLYLIGILGTLAALIIAIMMAKSITLPIGRLVKASVRIGKGDYSESIQATAKGEIGLLAETMEEMRTGVVQREQELKAMVAGVAHEIRNPLGGIELFAGLLADEVVKNSESAAHVERIAREVAYLKETVNSFLIYARPQKPNPEACPLFEIIKEVLSLVEREITKRDILVVMPDDLRDIFVWADPVHLRRIVLNLCQNAVQALPEGGTIQIVWNETRGKISLTIKDTGKGISEENRDKIFVPFFTTREKGTGLGLSIVKGLMEANGGTIQLARSDKNGTEFRLSFQPCK